MARPRTPAWVAGSVWALACAAAAVPCPAQRALFGPDSVLHVTLRTDLRSLLRDRDTTTAVWRHATFTFAGSEGPVTIPLRVRTRGIFRLKHCDFPPIRLRFSGRAARGTPFQGLQRPKLTTHCRNNDEYEQYVLEEYAIYRVLRLLTPLSLSTRLLRVTYEDDHGSARPLTRYAFVTEEPASLAERLGGFLVLEDGVPMRNLTRSNAAVLSVFQYFIGNTDWSAQGLHNIAEIIVQDTTYALPFDFDWSGVVEAPYARPAPVLQIRTVRERIYRGRCLNAADLEPVLARFEALRDTIAVLYRAIPGLTARNVERTIRYYDEFFRTIADRGRFARDVVQRDCIP